MTRTEANIEKEEEKKPLIVALISIDALRYVLSKVFELGNDGSYVVDN